MPIFGSIVLARAFNHHSGPKEQWKKNSWHFCLVFFYFEAENFLPFQLFHFGNAICIATRVENIYIFILCQVWFKFMTNMVDYWQRHDANQLKQATQNYYSREKNIYFGTKKSAHRIGKKSRWTKWFRTEEYEKNSEEWRNMYIYCIKREREKKIFSSRWRVNRQPKFA